MMRRIIIAVVAGFVFYSGPTRATPIIGFDPAAQVVDVGTTVAVDLTISGLGDSSSPSLGVFDLDVTFDDSILSLSSLTFGTFLGDEASMEAFIFPVDATIPGTVNLAEVSLLSDAELDLLQPAAFTLATLTFDTLAVGTGVLSVSVGDLILGDALGNPLSAEVQSGSITAVPEPATLLLLVLGLGALVAVRRRVIG